MSLNDNDLWLIERYLAEELSGQEEESFQKKMSQSIEFKQEFLLQQQMLFALKQEEDRVLKAELKEYAMSTDLWKKKTSSSKIYYYIAASVSLLIIAFYFLQPSSASLYEAYYTPLPEIPNVRGDQRQDQLFKAMQQYSIGNYEQALQLFKSVNYTDRKGEVDLYVGNCLLILNQPEEAIQTLKQVTELADDQIKSKANWYLALAYLKANNLPMAEEILTEISQREDDMYQQAAGEILAKTHWIIF